MAGLYVARYRDMTVISRVRLRVSDGRPVRRRWSALVETRFPAHAGSPDRSGLVLVAIYLPPVIVLLTAINYLGLALSGVLSGFVLFLMSALVSAVNRPARKRRRTSVAGARTLTAEAERRAFERAVATADRISETWPVLGGLVDVPAAEQLLAGALWEISGQLVRRQELTAVLAGLTRPDFAGLSPSDDLAGKLRTQIRATKEALSAIEIDLAAREASLRRVEEAGRTFIREHEMREAISAAERFLSDGAPPAATSDPAAELAERTQHVLAAYRELTTSGDQP